MKKTPMLLKIVQNFLLLSPGLLSFLFCSVAAGGEIKQPEHCSTVGMVIASHDSGITEGRKLCHTGKIVVGDQLSVKVLCLNNHKAIWIGSGHHQVSELCTKAVFQPKYCPKQHTCVRNSTARFPLISPISSAQSSNRPIWKWEPLVDAERYQIKIIPAGLNSIISHTTQSLSYSLPAEVPSLVRGVFYQVKLTGFSSEGNIVAQGTYALYVLSQDQMVELEKERQKIQHFSQHKEEEILFTDSLYMNLSLLGEAIDYLEQQSKEHPTPRILTRLGDRYLQAQRLDNAQAAYQLALSMGQKGKESYELALSRLDKMKDLNGGD